MGDSVKRTEPIWMFGKKFDWKVYSSSSVLNPYQYGHSGTAPAITPTRHQKNQICIHWTGSNNSGKSEINSWNNNETLGKKSSAHYIVELTRYRQNSSQPYVDIIEVVDSDMVTWHGGPINDTAIGIETSNVGFDWKLANGDSFTGTLEAKRPSDQNHFLHLANPQIPRSNMSHHDFQYFQEEQYLGYLMLLRWLCIKHRIPRRFLGDTKDEKMQRWWDELGPEQQLIRSRLMRFRGILSHMNVSGKPASKECGGPALNRNRLFRGIIDEWWLPVQVAGQARGYYMGPFDPQANQASYFRFSQGSLISELFHDANWEMLQETKSYFSLDATPFYYALTEDAFRGGSFPIGTNRIWHGGVHFEAPSSDPRIYAAASGTIVAARLGGDSATELNPAYGSQRFILIRHCVYTDQEPDPGGGTRTNYKATPKYFFTLYMHLAEYADLAKPNNFNPPWFNYWLRHKSEDANPNSVFYPQTPVPAGEFSGVPVSVGDWLGDCGQFRSTNVLHFEVISKEELTVAPWNDLNLRVYDTNNTLLCDSPALRNFIRSRTNKEIDEVDIIRAAPQLRNVKSYHKSEWALSGPDALVGLIPNPEQRQRKWNEIRPFMWVSDAIAACPDLAAQLCNANGMFWHYHPVTFMKFVNELVFKENEQVNEPDMKNTNVTMQDDYLSRFVKYQAGSLVDVPADSQALKPFDVSSQQFAYHLTRTDLACKLPGLHSPGANPQTNTHFHIALLDILESAREIYGQAITVDLSYVCPGHNTTDKTPSCIISALSVHNQGLACDIHPSSRTPKNCKDLWHAVRDAISIYNAACSAHSGEPSQPGLGSGLLAFRRSSPQIEAKLNTEETLTVSEAHSCVIHVELVAQSKTVLWQTHLKKPTSAISVRLQGGGAIATYRMQAEALRETAFQGRVKARGDVWDAWVRYPSKAIDISLVQAANGKLASIICTYSTLEDAESEKGADFAWPLQH